MKNTKWNDLSIKEKLAIGSACVAFSIGWILVAIAAFIPLLLSEQALLWILGQSLIYAASVFGVTSYFTAESVKLRHDVDRHLEHMERLQIERERLRHGIQVDEIPENNDEYEEQ